MIWPFTTIRMLRREIAERDKIISELYRELAIASKNDSPRDPATGKFKKRDL